MYFLKVFVCFYCGHMVLIRSSVGFLLVDMELLCISFTTRFTQPNVYFFCVVKSQVDVSMKPWQPFPNKFLVEKCLVV